MPVGKEVPSSLSGVYPVGISVLTFWLGFGDNLQSVKSAVK
jgi:hypothetical protein